MIINNTHRFIFVHVPKAAGSTVTQTLSRYSQYCDLEIGGTSLGEALQPYMRQRFGLHKHASAQQIRSVVGHAVFASYFSFAFVRNPFDRLQSVFHFLRGWENCPEALRQTLDDFEGFADFLDSELWISRAGPDNIFLPQTTWLTTPDGNLLVNLVGRVETIEQDLAGILSRLVGNGSFSIGRANRSEAYERHGDWSARQRDMVVDFYRSDFDHFGYSKDPA